MSNQNEAMDNDRNAGWVILFWLAILVFFVLCCAIICAGDMQAIMPEKFQISYWEMTKTYECKGKFPDGSTFNLTSDADLTYTQWKEKIKAAWQAAQEPPDLPVLYETVDYAIRDPNNGDLVFEWKLDNVRLNVTKTNLPSIVEASKKMNTIFAGMP